MYSQLKSYVKVSDKLTSYFSCKTCTRQGCISSTCTIFCFLFINDFILLLRSKCELGVFVFEDVEELYALMFADEVATFSDTVRALQRQIDIIDQFCTSIHMILNLDTSKVAVYHNGGIQTEKWYYRGKQMETIPFYNYLGLYITSTFSWTTSLETLSQQAMKLLC